MQFCEACRNMLYLRTTDVATEAEAEAAEADADAAPPSTRGLVWYCKACPYERSVAQAAVAGGDTAMQAVRVAHTSYTEDDVFHRFVNPHLRHDPTLPRIRDDALRCPNAACACASGGASDVLYFKYHLTELLYFYCCDACGHCDKREAFVRARKKEQHGGAEE